MRKCLLSVLFPSASCHAAPRSVEGTVSVCSPRLRCEMLIELLPYYAPKLTAVAVGWQKGEDFYSRLDRAVEASERAKLIEAKVIENTKED